jgi:hypothetical protein
MRAEPRLDLVLQLDRHLGAPNQADSVVFTGTSGVLPGSQLLDLVFLVNLHLAGELADLGQAAGTGFVGGQPAAGPGPDGHDLDEGSVEGASTQPGQPLQVGLAAGVNLLVAVTVGRQASLVQPSLQLVDAGLGLTGDGIGQPDQPGVAQLVPGEGGHHHGLAQVGDHVLQEPDISLVVGHGRLGGGWRTAGGQAQDQGPPSESAPPHGTSLNAHAGS